MRGAGRMAIAAAGLLWTMGCGDPEDPLEGLTVVDEDPSDNPLRGLDAHWEERFFAGDVHFEAVFRPSQGLGPLYIRHSCGSCHAEDARGPGAVRKMVVVEADGTASPDQSALPWGHTERPQLTAGATQGIVAPESGALVTRRFGPAVFGRGYLEAVRDDEIERLEREQAMRTDGISGRINRVPWTSEANPDQPFHVYGPGDEGLVGRFGLKARVATVDEFVADAYQGDMGITSPLRPAELPNPDGMTDDERPGVDVRADTVNLVADYVRLLALPDRAEPDARGATLFEEVRCAVCHVPSLRTRDDYPVPQLAGVDAPLYTDLLLHDMGADLADGLVEHGAGEREWKTAPLIGLRHLRNYLHDGRASTVEEAIRLHAGPGSEAGDSIDRFEALAPADRQALLDFVSAL